MTWRLKCLSFSFSVLDLLTIGLQKAFNRRNSGRSRAPRQAGGSVCLHDGCFFVHSTGALAITTVERILGNDHATLLFTDPEDVPPDENGPQNDIPKPDSGVSVILIETSEVQEE
jgi:hypothetical protein